MTATKPEPYKFCEVHFKANCPLCFVTSPVAQPNPNLNEVAPTKPTTERVTTPPVAPIVPPPVLTDPKAQKIVEAARKYAQAVEAAAIIADQVAQTEELLAALKKKLDETKQDVKTAMEETRAI